MSNSTQLLSLQCTRSPIKRLQPLSLFLSWSQPYIKAHFEVSSLPKPECEGFKCQLWYVSKNTSPAEEFVFMHVCLTLWRIWIGNDNSFVNIYYPCSYYAAVHPSALTTWFFVSNFLTFNFDSTLWMNGLFFSGRDVALFVTCLWWQNMAITTAHDAFFPSLSSWVFISVCGGMLV